jgi:4-amino-4-deoxy-L-arabinose transferase-like glycosyltransferase
VVASLVFLSAASLWFVSSRGWTLYYGDAEAHLNIARRIVDSRTPGWEQLGTVWLPLPHILMLPLVRYDELWRSGLAGAIPAALSFVLAGTFLFLAARRAFGAYAAYAAAAVFALNPNILYLQATPMTEAMFVASLACLLYFTLRFEQGQSLWSSAAAGAAATLGTLIRYEGWFVVPFAAGFILLRARRRRVAAVALFGASAALGPLVWLAHNRWYFGDALAFYRGPFSAMAIQGRLDYPGNDNWREAFVYFGTAARLCCGQVLLWVAAVGAAVALVRRVWWPVVLLILPPAFYVWSVHSSGTPIFVPELWPNSYYNTRYGLAALPFAAVCAAALVSLTPRRLRLWAALGLIVACSLPWALRPVPITWTESEANSRARRAWTQQAAEYLTVHYLRGSGVISSFGDITGVFRTAGIPLREVLTGDNGPLWLGATARPDLFLWEEWAVTMGGDRVQTGINRANRNGPHYLLTRQIIEKHAPVIEIYRRWRKRP